MIKNKENKITIFLLCLSPFIVFISNNGTFTIKDIFILIIIGFFSYLYKSNNVLNLNKLHKILLLLMGTIFLSTIINSIRHIAIVSSEVIIDYLYFLCIFIWFFCSTSGYISKESTKKIIKCYNIVSVIMSFQIIRMSLSGVQGKIMISNFVNTLMDENYVTALISATPIYVFINLLYEDKKLIHKIIDISIIIICSLAIGLAGSRAALIGLILGVGTTFIEYLSGKISVKKIIFILFIICIGIICIVNIKNIMPTWIYNRYFNSNYMDNSNTTRLMIWNNAMQGIKNQPLLGFGMGIFHNIAEYTYTAGRSSPAHQTILDFGLYGGIITMILFILFILSIVIPIIKNKITRPYIGVIICCACISMILSATKSMFLWNNLIYLTLILNNAKRENGGYIQ